MGAARGSGIHRRYSAEDARLGRALGVLTKHGCRGAALQRASTELRRLATWSGHLYVDHHGCLHLAMPEGAAWCLDLTWCARHPCCNAPTLAGVA